MASQELPASQSSAVALDLKKRDERVDSSITSIKPEGEVDSKQGAETAGSSAFQTKEPEWAHGFQLVNILVAVTFVCFLMLLDGTIVVAAVPRITDDFNSLNDIGWYGAAYQLGRYVDSSYERKIT